MDLILPSDKEHLVLQNLKLVYYLIKQMGIERNDSNYDDIVSIGKIGLIKAAITFDSSKKNTFSTYASRCINNEILMYFRKSKKYANNISLDETLTDHDDCILGNAIIDTSVNFTEVVEQEDYFIHIFNIILNCLRGIDRIALLYYLANLEQKKIAKLMNISRSYVSRLIRRATRQIQEVFNNQIHYNKKYNITKGKGDYWISFSSDYITNFDNILSKVVQELTLSINLPDFKVNYNNKRISILLPIIYDESFLFLATLIQELDKYY